MIPPSSDVSKLSLPWEREECAVGPAPLPQLAWAQLEAGHVEKAWAAREDAVGGMNFAIIRRQDFPSPMRGNEWGASQGRRPRKEEKYSSPEGLPTS